MIKVHNLTKKFKLGDSELTVLNNLNFTIPDSQFLAITGMSGAGKSTLLYQLGLLDHPSSGEISINTQKTLNLTHNERTKIRLNQLGYIFQDYAVLPTLTALENVMMPLLMQGITEKAATQKAEIALGKVGLDGKYNNLPSQLSGGQQQRVSIARAIAHNPSILFADEPTANLDTYSSKQIMEIFLTLNKQGQTIVMVTHEPEYAKLAQRVIELRDGQIISDKKSKIRH